MLVAIGDHKIEVIKVIREITGLGLREAKDLVEDAPSIIKEGLSWPEAEAIKAALEGAGATIILQTPPRWRSNGQYAPQQAGVDHGA